MARLLAEYDSGFAIAMGAHAGASIQRSRCELRLGSAGDDAGRDTRNFEGKNAAHGG